MGIVRRGRKWAIRYYGPDGRQRWETIGPNKKEAETVLAQRIYEVRSGKFPILQRRKRLFFRDFADEWQEKHVVRVRVSTSKLYKRLLRYHLLPAFGDRSLAALRPLDVQAYIAQQIQSGALAPKTVNNILALLKQMLKCAVDWGYGASGARLGQRNWAGPLLMEEHRRQNGNSGWRRSAGVKMEMSGNEGICRAPPSSRRGVMMRSLERRMAPCERR